jgi:hypothetical protein
VKVYAAPAQLHAAFEMYRAFPTDAQLNAAQRGPNDVPLFLAAGDESPGRFWGGASRSDDKGPSAEQMVEMVKELRELSGVPTARMPDIHRRATATTAHQSC